MDRLSLLARERALEKELCKVNKDIEEELSISFSSRKAKEKLEFLRKMKLEVLNELEQTRKELRSGILVDRGITSVV